MDTPGAPAHRLADVEPLDLGAEREAFAQPRVANLPLLKSKRVRRQNSASGFDELTVGGRDAASGGFDSQKLCEGHVGYLSVGSDALAPCDEWNDCEWD